MTAQQNKAMQKADDIICSPAQKEQIRQLCRIPKGSYYDQRSTQLRMEELAKTILQQQDLIINANTALAEKKSELTKIKAAMAQRDMELTKLKSAIAQKEMELTKLNALIAQKEIELIKAKSAAASQNSADAVPSAGTKMP